MAKQVNKPFLITLTVIILVGIVGAFLLVKKPWKKTPTADEFMARGEAAMAEKKHEEALKEFGSIRKTPCAPRPTGTRRCRSTRCTCRRSRAR
jgi:hypothetical protein